MGEHPWWGTGTRETRNAVDFGGLRRLEPISDVWGYDRGRPLDRYYIERFLEARAGEVRGRVLEVGDNEYTRRFGGPNVTASDVLHVKADAPGATIVGDLSNAAHIPSDAFDCFVLTQTLQLVYDLPAAVHAIHRILKPGGVVLATVPGITKIDAYEWRDAWCWSFTTTSVTRLFQEAFVGGNVEVEAHGNVLAAMAVLLGLADDELTVEELDFRDPQFQVLITVAARKAR